MGNYHWWFAVVLTAALAVVPVAESQGTSSGGVPSCATKLTGCADYINATKTPPSTCCGPLKEAITKEKSCLCGLYNNPEFLKTLGINITQALNLPKLCNIDTGKSGNICLGVAPSSSPGSASSTPGGGSGSGSASGSEGKNAAEKITGTIQLVSSFLLIVGTCLFFY